MDALRVTANNMFLNMMNIFRPIYGNYRNDHVMLRMLTRTDGFIWSCDTTIKIRLWLKGSYPNYQKNISNLLSTPSKNSSTTILTDVLRKLKSRLPLPKTNSIRINKVVSFNLSSSRPQTPELWTLPRLSQSPIRLMWEAFSKRRFF